MYLSGGGNISDSVKIKITKDGPYIVSDEIPLNEMVIIVNREGESTRWEVGKRYPMKKNSALCRCGESKNTPFCDGFHKEMEFNGTETADRRPYIELAEVHEGPDLRLTDFEDICAGARFCEPEGGTWELTEHSDDPRARELAITQTGNCPAGRIAVWEKKTGGEIEPELEPSLGLVEDPHENARGPIWVRGRIPIESADGHIYEIRNRVTLCRCGWSSNKPFCDGSHFD